MLSRNRVERSIKVVLFCVLAFAIAIGPSLKAYTASAASQPFTFAAEGDSNTHPDPDSTGPLLDRLSSSGVSFLLALGDLGYTDDEQGWCTWAKAHFNNIIVIVGNHDSDESGPGDISTTIQYCTFTLASQGVTLVGAPNTPGNGYGFAYYFDYPSTEPLARFFMVPFGNTGCVSEQTSFCFTSFDWDNENSQEMQWFINGIRDAKTRGLWTIAGMHEECISSAMRGCDMSGDYASQFEFDVMIREKVDLILVAHNHVYDRSKQLALGADCPTVLPDPPGDPDCVVDADAPYERGLGSVTVTQGTGGAGLYDVACGSVYYVASMDGVNTCGGTGAEPDGRGAVKYTVATDSVSVQTDFDTSYSDSWTISGTGGSMLPGGFQFPIPPTIFWLLLGLAVGIGVPLAVLGLRRRSRKSVPPAAG